MSRTIAARILAVGLLAIAFSASRVNGESGAVARATAAPEWKNIRILNNLCWELLNVEAPAEKDIGSKHAFTLPCDRWVFIRSVAEVPQGAETWVAIDAEGENAAATRHDQAGSSTLEAMRYLKAGPHTVHIGSTGDAKVRHLVARAVPALQHAFYNSRSHIRPYGPYDWEFLKKDILPNVNVMISSTHNHPPGFEEDIREGRRWVGDPEGGWYAREDHLQEWTASGRHWITIKGVGAVGKLGKGITADQSYECWANCMGFLHPLMHGIIVDEFGRGDSSVFAAHSSAVERIYSEPKFKGKTYSPYVVSRFLSTEYGKEFGRACLDGGGYLCLEIYIAERPSRGQAEAVLRKELVSDFAEWEKALPGVTARTVVVLGLLSQPTESLNVHPGVNFNVFMDMQMRTLATDPNFFGLGGVQQYHCAYADEESIRWAGRLYRHYCIEGNTAPLTDDPYALTHIRNPDFADGTNGWEIHAAEPGSVKTMTHERYGRFQFRYKASPGDTGDTFLWTKRNAEKANVFSQDIVGLEPGRLYSMKMVTGDYQDFVQGRDAEHLHAVAINLESVEPLSGPKKSFQFAFPNHHGRHLGKFGGKHLYRMNYHWRVFRANGTSARLTVSDWKTETEQGGPVGQELMYNFIEIQPYLKD